MNIRSKHFEDLAIQKLAETEIIKILWRHWKPFLTRLIVSPGQMRSVGKKKYDKYWIREITKFDYWKAISRESWSIPSQSNNFYTSHLRSKAIHKIW